MYLLLDLAILLILGLCAWRGAKKGLILTLCSLLAVVVAFLGATFVSNQFSPTVAEFIQPYIESYVDGLVDDAFEQPENDPSGPLNSWTDPSGDENDTPATLDQILAVLDETGLFSLMSGSIRDAIQSGALVVATTAAAAISAFLALQLARVGLFLISFLLIAIVWWLVSHILDLAFRLPVLRTLNKTGGLLFGLAKGLLVLLVACWAIEYFRIIDPDLTSRTYLFSLFLNFQLL